MARKIKDYPGISKRSRAAYRAHDTRRYLARKAKREGK
jgi:hypothetical protein